MLAANLSLFGVIKLAQCARTSVNVLDQGLRARRGVIMASGSPLRNISCGPGIQALRERSCQALGSCSKDTRRLNDAEIGEALQALPSWHLDNERKSLTKAFTAKNFVAAVKFFDEVAHLAEREGHHPDLHLTDYREVKVQVSTHAIKGLSWFDIILAAKIDALPVDYSPKWLRLQQQ